MNGVMEWTRWTRKAVDTRLGRARRGRAGHGAAGRGLPWQGAYGQSSREKWLTRRAGSGKTGDATSLEIETWPTNR